MANVLKGIISIDASGVKQGMEAAGASVRKFEKQLEGLATGSIAQLRKAAQVLKAQLENLTPSSLNTSFAKQLKGALATVNTELARMEKQAGLAGSSASGAFSKAYAGISKLAYLIPGIGIGGLITIFSEQISKAFQGIASASTRLSESITGAKDKFVAATVSVNELRNNIDLAKDGFISKDGVVKQYNETLGKTFGFVKNLDEAEQGLVKNGNAFIQITLQKAVASIAQAKAAETLFKILEQQRKPFGANEYFKNTFDIDPQVLILKGLNKELTDFQKIAADANRAAADLSKEFNANFFGDNTPAKKIKTEPEKYVREIIALAKKYSSFFKDNIDITPGFSIFDSIKDEFEKSKKFLEKFNTGQFKIKLLVNAEMSFPPEQVKPVATDFGVMFQKELNGYFNKSDPTDFGLQDFINNQAEFFSNANPDIIGVELQAFLIKAYAGAKNKAVLINAATELANSFNDALQSGLRNSLFAIGEDIGDIFSGKNPAGAFINVISGMLQQIGAALIAFGTAGVVFKEILADLVKFFVTNPAIAIAAGVAAVAAGQLLKNSISGARALGGPVSSGGTYLVGERGPELFRPNTGGQIIPNNQLGGRGAFMGGGMQFQIVGTNVIRGKDLVQIFTLQQLSNNRLV